MMFVWNMAVLLLAARSEAQSGGGDSESDLRLSCFSHISFTETSLTCELLGDSTNEDDEDVEGDGIKNMDVCQRRWVKDKDTKRCLNAVGPSITSKDLNPLSKTNVTVHLKTGGEMSTTVNLQKIVKPRSPQVCNVTFNLDSNHAVISIQTVQDDYLTLDKLFFQMYIWTNGVTMIQNISSQNFIQISMQHLHQHSQYNVKVRAIPQGHLQGTWSRWSETWSFTPPEVVKRTDDWQVMVYGLGVCLVCLIVVMSSLIVFCRRKIFTYMWPSIPHPKQTLVQICRPNRGLLLNLNPEVFSSLKVYPLDKTDCDETEPSLHPAALEKSQSSSTQSSDCRSATSISTEELEISALLSRSSSEGEDGVPNNNQFPVHVLQQEDRPSTPQPNHSSMGNEFGAHQQEEAYVTMSSFYQVK